MYYFILTNKLYVIIFHILLFLILRLVIKIYEGFDDLVEYNLIKQTKNNTQTFTVSNSCSAINSTLIYAAFSIPIYIKYKEYNISINSVNLVNVGEQKSYSNILSKSNTYIAITINRTTGTFVEGRVYYCTCYFNITFV